MAGETRSKKDMKESIGTRSEAEASGAGKSVHFPPKPTGNALDKSKLVAVPQVLPLKKPIAMATPSSARSTVPPVPSTTAPVESHGHSENHVRSEYNVYATSFIPSALRAINYEDGQVIVTETKHKINFTSYIKTFVGKSFLPERRTLRPHQFNYTFDSGRPALSEETYLQYFLDLQNLEIDAKRRENDIYALYRVKLGLVAWPDGREIFKLTIPGLREDSPLVELGDVIQLRQVWVDTFGNVIKVPTSAGGSAFHRPVLMTWGGIQYDAAIYGISRKDETVYLSIEGLIPQTLVFNVVFPLKEKILQSQWDALQLVSQEVRRASTFELPNAPMHDFPQLCQSSANVLNATVDQPNNMIRTRTESLAPSEIRNDHNAQNDWIRRILFPVPSDGVLQTELRSIPHERGLFDPKFNYEQLQVVNSVCKNEYGTLPFLISGPPGTGKTKTLVELALQLLNTTKIAHILICAPSEAASDTLALRLSQSLSPKELLRLNGPGRADNEVPRELLQYSYREQEMFYLPPFAQLMRYNIVVTSCKDASILLGSRVTNLDLYMIEKNMSSAFRPESPSTPCSLHWGALLIDEAAQATEIEALVPLSVVIPPSEYSQTSPQPRFVMAGDQNQLGPRTASRDSNVSTSLFARLFSRPIYSQHPLSRSNMRPSAAPLVLKRSMLPMLYPPFANLIRNYRSHPAILSVPSSLFYNDTLIPEAHVPDTALQASSLWRGRRWPVLYVPHTMADEIEREGGGWYNISEARIACNLAQHLIFYDGVKQQDICIMSPFAAQVRTLRATIRSNLYGGGSGLWDVNIGPLEAFQGLESRVVIICTTRTRERFLDMDTQRGLGIVGQRRKMNVAVTRAMEGLFVIGSPVVLGKDEWWSEFVAFCARNGLVDGNVNITSGNRKIGVLEKALLVQEETEKEVKSARKMLGAGYASKVAVGDDEMWTAGLRAALDGWGETEDADELDEYEEEHENDGSGRW